MARGRTLNLSRLSAYERRVFARLGMLPAEAKSRGISLAAARGHAPKRLTPEGPVLKEHQIRAIRARERGEPTPAERAFLMRQQYRAGSDYEDLLPIFMSYSPSKRDSIREHVAAAHRRWRGSHARWRWELDAPSSWGSFPDPKSGEGKLMYYH